MKTVHAIYEAGVFRPIDRVDLPERCQVEFEPRVIEPDREEARDHLEAVYQVLSERHDSGYHDTAERHDEHQP